MFKIGQGYDAHRFGGNKPLIIGGVHIEYDQGLLAHSDGDVLIHALIDALLGALGEGDIGRLFPDNDSQYENCDSMKLLGICLEKMRSAGFQIGNIDLTLVAQAPKFAPYIDAMKMTIAKNCDCAESQVNVKATTTEGMGFEGRKEGIAAMAVILLQAGSEERGR